jgi:hypothetical protein
MIRKLQHRALRLYPAAFRERYGAELSTLIDDSPARTRDLVNLLGGAVSQHIRPEAALQASLPRTARVTASVRGVIYSWLLFVIAGLGFYKTTENDAAHKAVSSSGVLPPAHFIVQALAVIAGIAIVLSVAALIRADREDDSPEIQSRDLRGASLLASVVGWSMLVMAIATITYSVALSIQAPALADALDGPLQANSASISIDLQFLLMLACSIPALVAGRRARLAART